MKIFLLIFLSLTISSLFSQNKKNQKVVQAEMEKNITAWSEGTVIEEDGVERNGRLQYNALDQVLICQDKDISRTYTPKNVSGLNFGMKLHSRNELTIPLCGKSPIQT